MAHLGIITVVIEREINSTVQLSLLPVLPDLHFSGLYHKRCLTCMFTPDQVIN